MIFDKDYILHTLSVEIKEEWNRAGDAVPGFLTFIDENGKRENEERLAESIELLKTQLNCFPYPISFFGKKKRWKRDTENLLDEILWKEPLLSLDGVMEKGVLDEFKAQTKAFVQRVRAFDSNLGMNDMGQALRNYIVYAIFRELNGLPQKCTSAIFGYSMLYPYTDNYIDDSLRSTEEKRHYNQLIADKIKGKSYEALSEYEEKTAELLEKIEEDYQRPDEIFEGLYLMLQAQRDSERQSNQEELLNEDRVLDVSIYKGGISVLIDRYFADKPLNEKDVYFYYGFGFLLQLCDDLQDISQDRENGSRTVFTICKTKEETERNINRLLWYTKNLFDVCECEREEFKQFLLRNCYLLILFSAVGSKEHVTEEWLSRMEGNLPVSQEYFYSFKADFSEDALEKQNARYMRMMDVLLKA